MTESGLRPQKLALVMLFLLMALFSELVPGELSLDELTCGLNRMERSRVTAPWALGSSKDVQLCRL